MTSDQNRKHYFLDPQHEPESYPYEPYECIVCGRREDEIPDDETDTSSIVYPSNSGEPTASETFVCGKCIEHIRPLDAYME